jgi:hypothetical protein
MESPLSVRVMISKLDGNEASLASLIMEAMPMAQRPLSLCMIDLLRAIGRRQGSRAVDSIFGKVRVARRAP